MPKYSDNSEYREPTKEEHGNIASFLRKNHFFEDVKKQTGYYDESNKYVGLSKHTKNLLLGYLEQALIGFNVKYEEICKNLGYKGNSKSNVSRLTKALNFYLNEFCKEKKVNPPVQLFYYHKNCQGDIKGDFDCHLACAKVGTQDNSRRYSYGIVTLKEAEKRGMLEGQKICQKKPASSVGQLEETLELHNKVLTVDKDNKEQNLFRFEYRWPKFAGRIKEKKRLYQFVNCENANLLWWSVTGKGGSGKSRLALELCCELEKQGWYAGFLTNTNGPDVWRKWKPQRPTLIVVDYNHEKAKEFGEYVGNKYEESKQWGHPVRILFLERNEDVEALREFCRPHREILENNIRYNEIGDDKKNKPLKLKGLGDEFIDSIITEVFDRYLGKQPSADEVKTIKSFLKEKGHENRPLYAIFIADACARGENVRGWDTEKLHKSVLEHNKNIWRGAGIDEANDLDKKHINLLTLATMTNGIDVSSTKYDKCLDKNHNRLKALDILPAKHEFQNNVYKIRKRSGRIG